MTKGEKTCPQCAEQVKVAAKVCKHCGYTFTAADDAALAKKATSSQAAAGCIVIVVLLLIVSMCSSKVTQTSGPGAADTSMAEASASADAAMKAAGAVSKDAAAAAAEAATAAGEPASNWSYSEQKDQLRNKSVQYAEISSENEVEFGFPYGGGSRLTMTIRKSPQYGQDVIFKISSGQFVCGVESCSGAISFDGKSDKLSLSQSADYSSDALFATYGEAIIQKLKSSDKTIVELPFYQEGNRQFVFNTKGLVWPPKPQ